MVGSTQNGVLDLDLDPASAVKPTDAGMPPGKVAIVGKVTRNGKTVPDGVAPRGHMVFYMAGKGEQRERWSRTAT